MALNWFKKNKKFCSTDANGPDTEVLLTSDLSDGHNQNPQTEQEEDRTTAPAEATGDSKNGIFSRLRNRLSKTRTGLSTGLKSIFSGRKFIDDDALEDLEELLITSDIGVKTSMDLIRRISKKTSGISDEKQLNRLLKQEIIQLLSTPELADSSPPEFCCALSKPHVILVLGVNGVGKTTTIGKLAAKFTASGQKVMIAAADTFRAAAVEQLTIWADRAGADIVKHKENADPAAVAYDAIEAAVARGTDIVLIDTAGRIHTKINLMEELKKIKRTISKIIPDAPHETLLILDATTGQNALSQTRLFHEAVGVTGIALTKLDGTAKGGIVIGICSEMNIPLKYIGIGEQVDDLQDFDPVAFADALL